MTVHGAKGLQAPIVILPDTTHTLGTGDIDLLWNTDGLMFWPGRAENITSVTRALQMQEKARMDEEALRLLYVAMTRAEDELYICGHFKNKPQPHSWHSILTETMRTMEKAAEVELPFMPEGYKKGYCLACHATATQPASRAEEPAYAPRLPDYFLKAAKKETATRSLSPSRMGHKAEAALSLPLKNEARIKGTAVHRLLELLPELPMHLRKEAGRRLLTSFTDLSNHETVLGEVLSILEHPEFSPLFSEGSLAEVNLTGMIAGRKYSGQVDRLVVLPDKILLVDYKTNRKVPENEAEVPEAYLQQMAIYGQLLEQIYPDKTIVYYLLWSAGPSLMPLEKQWLSRYIPQVA
jgi:ATP-dependent helicase/nuclease subunit A